MLQTHIFERVYLSKTKNHVLGGLSKKKKKKELAFRFFRNYLL